jgi:hypothetical protein
VILFFYLVQFVRSDRQKEFYFMEAGAQTGMVPVRPRGFVPCPRYLKQPICWGHQCCPLGEEDVICHCGRSPYSGFIRTITRRLSWLMPGGARALTDGHVSINHSLLELLRNGLCQRSAGVIVIQGPNVCAAESVLPDVDGLRTH